MGLIIGSKIQALMPGYPTISDKYDVCGGKLVGTTNVKNGALVKKGSTPGTYEAITTTVTLAQIGGFVLATNVKTPTVYPANTAAIETAPGEVFNLLLRGGIAVELDAGCTVANITEGAKVGVLLASGKLTTSGATNATDLVINGSEVRFTGIYENHGTAAAPKYVAEVILK